MFVAKMEGEKSRKGRVREGPSEHKSKVEIGSKCGDILHSVQEQETT